MKKKIAYKTFLMKNIGFSTKLNSNEKINVITQYVFNNKYK